MTSPTSDTVAPRVQAVRITATLLFEDGVAVAVATKTQDVPRDVFEDATSTSEHELAQILDAHGKAVGERVVAEGVTSLYHRAKAEAEARRQAVEARAAKARKRHEAKAQGEEKSSE